LANKSFENIGSTLRDHLQVQNCSKFDVFSRLFILDFGTNISQNVAIFPRNVNKTIFQYFMNFGLCSEVRILFHHLLQHLSPALINVGHSRIPIHDTGKSL
jgi:hypothetical protein